MARWPGILVACAASAGLGIGCDRPPTGPAPPGRLDVRAVTLADWTATGYASPGAATSLDEIADVGANAVMFLLTLYQRDATSSAPRAEPGLTLEPTTFAVAVSRARARGLDPILKIHVDLLDGQWRGTIQPTDPAAWFDAYGSVVVAWAQRAQDHQLSALVIGTELAGTIRFEAEWRALIERCRAVYDGTLLYAATWDAAEIVPFWDALDAVGVDFYDPVAMRSNAGRFEILANWQPKLDRLERLCHRAGRDLWITEIGYRSCDGAGMEPANYERFASVDLEEQADLYWAALTATADEPWIRGLAWWTWEMRAAGGAGDDGYTPRGKPAEQVLRDAWLEAAP